MIYKLQFFILLFLLQFNNANAQISFSTSEELIQYLNGDWMMIEYCGGFDGGCNTPDIDSQLKFEEIDGVTNSIHYTKYDGGELTFEGTADIQLANDPNVVFWELEFDSGVFLTSFTGISPSPLQDTIAFFDNYCADCYVYTYRRLYSTSNEELSDENNITIFPNPSKETLNISSQSILDKVVIYDSSARKVLTRYQVNKIIDISELNSGIYFIEIHTSDKIQKSRFIKT